MRAASGDNADAMTDRLDQDAVRALAHSIFDGPYESDHNAV